MNITSLESFLNNFIFIVLFFNFVFSWILIKYARFSIIFSNFLLLVLLIFRYINSLHFPLSNLYESLIFLSWSLTLVQIILDKVFKNKILFIITSPITLFTYMFATFSLPEELQKAGPLIPALQSNWLIMHVTIMILSYAFLLIGCLLAITFLIIYIQNEIQFKNQKVLIQENFYNKFDKFSNKQQILLENLDNFSYRTLSIGFFFLTLGILSGAVWANSAWGSYWSWDPKETWAFITWLIFASYLHMRILKGWNREKSAGIATIGFFTVWACYLGVNILGKGLHSYGWFQ